MKGDSNINMREQHPNSSSGPHQKLQEDPFNTNQSKQEFKIPDINRDEIIEKMSKEVK
jgi:hypothetical protein